MKARVKATGEIVDGNAMVFFNGDDFYLDELEAIIDETEKIYDELDEVYWKNLEHQYAGMAMQGVIAHYGVEPLPDDAAHDAYNYAHALVEMMKEERK